MQPAIQLYSVREMDASLPEIVRRAGAAGFRGVEFGNRIVEADTDAVAGALAETGLEVVGAHVSLSDIESDLEGLRALYEPLGCRHLIVPHVSPWSLRTEARIRRLGRRLGEATDRLAEAGFELSYHNQARDFRPPVGTPGLEALAEQSFVPGLGEKAIERLDRRLRDRVPVEETAIGRLAEATPDALGFELDLGWAAAAGYDPETVLAAFPGRTRLVHIADVAPGADGHESVRPGTGIVPFDRAAAAARRHGVEWFIYEHDQPEDAAATLRHGAEAVVPLTDAEERTTV